MTALAIPDLVEEDIPDSWNELCWPDGPPIERGQRVRCARKCPPKGTWSRFQGQEGTVQDVVATITESGLRVWVGEVGVHLGDRVGLVWFRPDELVSVTSVTGSQTALLAPLAPLRGHDGQKDSRGRQEASRVKAFDRRSRHDPES